MSGMIPTEIGKLVSLNNLDISKSLLALDAKFLMRPTHLKYIFTNIKEIIRLLRLTEKFKQ